MLPKQTLRCRSFPGMDTYLQIISSLLEVRNTDVLKGDGSVTLYHPNLVKLKKDIANDRKESTESCMIVLLANILFLDSVNLLFLPSSEARQRRVGLSLLKKPFPGYPYSC
ncbi:uncharacterized protein TNCV_1415451 [Trichonephila clavipes]|nr:uncharacterized protein TNCV_1415451 [Trichonephila clavipes]